MTYERGLFYGITGPAVAAVALLVIYGLTSANASQLARELMPLAPIAIIGSCTALLLLAGLALGGLDTWISFPNVSKNRKS